MAVTLDLPDDAHARLEAEAARRGITLAQLVTQLADQFPDGDTTSEGEMPRRKLAFLGMGASKRGRMASDADEMLAEGFGRD